MKQFKVIGVKQTPTEPFHHHKTGELIYDGRNREVTLMSSDQENLIDFFYTNITKRIPASQWKITKKASYIDV